MKAGNGLGRLLELCVCFGVVVLCVLVTTAQMSMQGSIYFTASPTSGGDYLSVWQAGFTPGLVCATTKGCLFAIQTNGNIWFAGNNATYGAPNQTSQSWLRLIGGSTPYAPSYVDFQTTDGVRDTLLFASTTVPGQLCVGSAIPGGDCPPGSQLVTQAQLPSSGGPAVASNVPFISTAARSQNPVWQANVEPVWGFVLPGGGQTFDQIVVDVITADTAGRYSFAIYQNCSGNAIASTAPQGLTAGMVPLAVTQGTVTVSGLCCIGMTGTATTMQVGTQPGTLVPFYSANVGKTSGGAVLPSIPAQTETWATGTLPAFVLDPGPQRRRHPR